MIQYGQRVMTSIMTTRSSGSHDSIWKNGHDNPKFRLSWFNMDTGWLKCSQGFKSCLLRKKSNDIIKNNNYVLTDTQACPICFFLSNHLFFSGTLFFDQIAIFRNFLVFNIFELFGTTDSGPEELKLNVRDHWQWSRRIKNKCLGPLTVVPNN